MFVKYCRLSLPIVSGYVVDSEKPWCAGYARSEPSYSQLLRRRQVIRVQRTKYKINRKKLAGQQDISGKGRKIAKE